MPPWLPEPGDYPFEGDARLGVEEIAAIRNWVEQGCLEGEASDLPAQPEWKNEWQLGTPDLVLRIPQVYLLAAEGPDIYRNFVIATGLTGKRYVKGVEFRPDNPNVVHHVFVRVDMTKESRLLEEKEKEPGFPGIGGPAKILDGHFLGWQPGRVPTFVPNGMAWELNKGDDIVLSMHLRRSGKVEEVNASLGLVFHGPAANNKELSAAAWVADTGYTGERGELPCGRFVQAAG